MSGTGAEVVVAAQPAEGSATAAATRIIDCDVHHQVAEQSDLFPFLPRRYVERENEILKCPWHQWEFDITTGRALYDEKMQVKTYHVALEDNEIILYVWGRDAAGR